MVSFTLAAAVAFVASASLVQGVALKTMTDKGCYKSSKGLTFNDTWTFQSTGYCQEQCVPMSKPVMGLTAAGDCWCGDTLPPADTLADSKYCDTACNGWPTDLCGSADGVYFNLWNTGIKSTVLNYGATTTSSSDDASSTSSAKPSVVTVGGQTQTITAASTPKSSSSAGTNKAGIAAGVVVGVIAIAALAGGAFFFMRRKQKREEEDEIKRQEAINSFMSAKPRSSGGMSSNDSRLDPIIMTRRQSDGSIMDNQDYSRRILKVTNA